QPFAMIRKEDDERAVVGVQAFELGEEIADDLIGGRDLAVIRQLVARGERLRRRVGSVRLVDVEKEEERFSGELFQPALGLPEGFAPRPLETAQAAILLEL